MSKYVKVMYGDSSGANALVKYKINEVNISDNWNPLATNPKEFGGFNYCDEKCILRMAEVLTEEESRIVKGGDKYKIKFKIVEIYEDIFKREK